MSLLEAFLEDSLLNTVMQQEVWLAIRTDGANGSGTESDPWNCAVGGPASFDFWMRHLWSVHVPTVVRLQPGTYYTDGYNTSSQPDPSIASPKGWLPYSGLRIVGSGVGISILKITNSAPTSLFTAAIGGNYANAAHFLTGFEVSDLTIDASSSAAASGGSTGGIAVTGSRIYIRSVLVIGFGLNYAAGAVTAYGISIGRSFVTNPSLPENCVIENCRAESPGATNSAVDVIAFHVGAVADATHAQVFHRYCVIRNCYVDFGAGGSWTDLQKNYTAIVAGGGIGTIVEGNRILNCGMACRSAPAAYTTTKDLILRNNLCYNVLTLFSYPLSASDSGFRLILLGNTVNWPPISVTSTNLFATVPIGSQIGKVIIRDNVFRRQDDTPNGDEAGLALTSCGNLILENNLINVLTSNPDSAVRHNLCTTTKVFNNRITDGTLLRGLDTGTSLHDPELTTDAEDTLLGL